MYIYIYICIYIWAGVVNEYIYINRCTRLPGLKPAFVVNVSDQQVCLRQI